MQCYRGLQCRDVYKTSSKTRSVQLYCSLVLRNKQINEMVLKGFNVYTNYCAVYNDCAPLHLPRFTSVDDYVKPARNIVCGNQVLDNCDVFVQCIIEI